MKKWIDYIKIFADFNIEMFESVLYYGVEAYERILIAITLREIQENLENENLLKQIMDQTQ